MWVCCLFWGKYQIPKEMTSSGQIFYCKRYRDQHLWNSHSKLCQETNSPKEGQRKRCWQEHYELQPCMCVPREIISGLIFSILMSQQQHRKRLQIIPPVTATSINYWSDSLIPGKSPWKRNVKSWSRRGIYKNDDNKNKKENRKKKKKTVLTWINL